MIPPKASLDEQIFEVERRIAHQRAQSLRAFDDYKEHLRDQTTSWASLGTMVVAGFLAGRLLRARKASPEARPGLGLASLLVSLATALVRAYSYQEQKAAEELFLRRHGAMAEEPTADVLAVEQGRGGPT